MELEANNGQSQVDFLRLPEVFDIELLHVRNVTYNYPLHLHEDYSLAIVVKGIDTHIQGDKTYVAKPGSVVLINAGEPHSNLSKNVEYLTIKIKPEILHNLVSDCIEDPRHPYFPTPVIKDKAIFDGLFQLGRVLRQNVSTLEKEDKFLLTLGFLLSRLHVVNGFSSQPKEKIKIDGVCDYITDHHTENITLSQLAKLADLSRFHLVRTFSKYVGVPPHEYQTQLRISHCRKLLREGCSITDAAIQTGFCDQSHLSRNFKRIVGTTPGRYPAHSNIVQDA